MLKAVFAVIAGYIVMALFVLVTTVIAFMAMGAQGAYRAGTFEPTPAWIVVVFALGFIAAMVGGFVAALIAGRPGPPRALAVLVVLLGVIFALPSLRPGADTRATVRTADVTALQAMAAGRQPTWVTLVMPLVGAAGVLTGATRHKPH